MNNPSVLIASIIGVFLIVMVALIGTILLALHYPSVVQSVITILAAITGSFVTAVTLTVTHFLAGQQEQQRLMLANGLISGTKSN